MSSDNNFVSLKTSDPNALNASVTAFLPLIKKNKSQASSAAARSDDDSRSDHSTTQPQTLQAKQKTSLVASIRKARPLLSLMGSSQVKTQKAEEQYRSQS